MDAQTKRYVIRAIRRINSWDKAGAEALKLSRIDKGVYVCAHCEKPFGGKDVRKDHIVPIEAVTGWDGWDALFERAWCGVKGYQILCVPCHKVKTQKENSLRRANQRLTE